MKSQTMYGVKITRVFCEHSGKKVNFRLTRSSWIGLIPISAQAWSDLGEVRTYSHPSAMSDSKFKRSNTGIAIFDFPFLLKMNIMSENLWPRYIWIYLAWSLDLELLAFKPMSLFDILIISYSRVFQKQNPNWNHGLI